MSPGGPHIVRQGRCQGIFGPVSGLPTKPVIKAENVSTYLPDNESSFGRERTRHKCVQTDKMIIFLRSLIVWEGDLVFGVRGSMVSRVQYWPLMGTITHQYIGWETSPTLTLQSPIFT